MVLAEVGGSVAADAVFEDADAIDVETPDDRPAGSAGREAGAGNAGLGKQEVAERSAARAADFLVRHHREHTLLRRGCDRRRLRLRRRLTIAAGSSAGDPRRRS